MHMNRCSSGCSLPCRSAVTSFCGGARRLLSYGLGVTCVYPRGKKGTLRCPLWFVFPLEEVRTRDFTDIPSASTSSCRTTRLRYLLQATSTLESTLHGGILRFHLHQPSQYSTR